MHFQTNIVSYMAFYLYLKVKMIFFVKINRLNKIVFPQIARTFLMKKKQKKFLVVFYLKGVNFSEKKNLKDQFTQKFLFLRKYNEANLNLRIKWMFA